MTKYIGEIAALTTAFSWSFSSIFFTISSKRIGHKVVNHFRLTLALLFLFTAHFLIYGRIVPENITMPRLFWLGLSGFIGLAIGDRMLFKTYVMIGPRLGMLLMSLTPVISAVAAWFFLHEALTIKETIAILITLAGIFWVMLEKKNGGQTSGKFAKGVLLGVGAAVCQVVGLILSKKGLEGDFPALSANIIRVAVSVVLMWTFPFLREGISASLKKFSDRKATLALIGGAFFGPFCGIWLSLIAIKYSYIGIASTLMALPPIILLPLSSVIFKEKISIRAVLGTVVAIFGIAMIFYK